MTRRAASELSRLILSLHGEAILTAAAKGLSGMAAELAALQETASLASGPAGRTVSEEEVMRLVLLARRFQNLGQAGAAADAAASAAASAGSTPGGSLRPVAKAPLGLRLRGRRLSAVASAPGRPVAAGWR